LIFSTTNSIIPTFFFFEEKKKEDFFCQIKTLCQKKRKVAKIKLLLAEEKQRLTIARHCFIRY